MNQGVIEIADKARFGQLSPEDVRDLIGAIQQLSENVIKQAEVNQAFINRLLHLERRLAKVEVANQPASCKSSAASNVDSYG
jgi:hypothetical protein